MIAHYRGNCVMLPLCLPSSPLVFWALGATLVVEICWCDFKFHLSTSFYIHSTSEQCSKPLSWLMVIWGYTIQVHILGIIGDYHNTLWEILLANHYKLTTLFWTLLIWLLQEHSLPNEFAAWGKRDNSSTSSVLVSSFSMTCLGCIKGVPIFYCQFHMDTWTDKLCVRQNWHAPKKRQLHHASKLSVYVWTEALSC